MTDDPYAQDAPPEETPDQPAEDEQMPDFPDYVAVDYGGSDYDASGETADTGDQKICLEFCIWANGRPWKDMWFCAFSPEQILDQVALFLQALTSMGFRAEATQGACPYPPQR